MNTLLPILAAAALVGCASNPVVAPPQIVHVTRIQYAPLPAADLVPCRVAATRVLTGAGVVAAWQRTLSALAVCDSQISDLSRLNEQSSKENPKP